MDDKERLWLIGGYLSEAVSVCDAALRGEMEVSVAERLARGWTDAAEWLVAGRPGPCPTTRRGRARRLGARLRSRVPSRR